MEHKASRLHPSVSTGLGAKQVYEQIQKGLVNVQPKGTEKTVWQIIRDNTFTLFNLFNVSIAVCIFLVGAYRNLLFMALVVLNTLLGIIQEIRTKRLVAKLSLLSAPRAHAVRDSKVMDIAIEELVLDDIILLETGNQISADAIVQEGEVEVNEALLTGEADPVLKRAGDMLLSGSFVISGRCYAKVEHLGKENYAVSIAQDAKKHKKLHSKLMNTLDQVVKITGFYILPFGAVLMLRSLLLLHLPIQEAVTTTAAALLGMMPKGLVLLTSASLMLGVIKLAKCKTLIHELFGIETLSRVDMLCLDKTGTLTEGHMQVSDWAPLCDLDKRDIEERIGTFLHAQTDANATIEAIRQFFKKKPTEYEVKIIPFSSSRKWSAVSFIGQGSVLMGAPDILWPKKLGEMPGQITEFEQDGARVILFAQSKQQIQRDLPEDITPLAAVALRDPLRSDAGEILEFFRQEGVAIRIISGDHPNTLKAIAKKAGMANADRAIDMKEIQDEQEIKKAALEHTIFGRVSPQQKRILIRALHDAGHTVAMMGDGVNDVLALRDADCSITLASGTEAARNISQIVLLDNNFGSLPSVVMEGRRVVNNIQRTASLYLVKTVYSFVITFITIFSAIRYPYIPIQLTLIGTLMEGIPSFFLAMEPNGNRIDERFFNVVLQRALPTGLVIATLVALINATAGIFGLDHLQIGTLCVYVTGAFCAVLLYMACQPFNNARLLLWTVMTALFILLAGFFPEVFQMQPLTWLLAMQAGIFILSGAGLLWLYSKVVMKLVKRHAAKIEKAMQQEDIQ